MQTHRTLPDGKTEVTISKSTSNFEGPLETILYILDHINKQEFAYDGIAGFSQGYFLISSLFKVAQYFRKEITLRHPLPTFALDFAAARWDFFTFEWLKDKFVGGDVFIPGVETIHFKSETDPLYRFLSNELNVECGVVLMFDDGHRPPKILKETELLTTAEFFKRQYCKKFPVSNMNFEKFFSTLKTSSLLPRQELAKL